MRRALACFKLKTLPSPLVLVIIQVNVGVVDRRMTPFDLNLRHLEAASAIVRLGSISAAAAAINLSQPATTQAIAKLEGLLGRRLFDRHPGGVTATAAGHLLAGRVDRALTLLTEAARATRRAARLPPLGPIARQIGMAQLRAAIAVDRAGSYVGAAAEIHLSQPAIHRAVRELELMLGVPLVARDGKTLRLSQPALRFVPPARLAIAELQAALDELGALEAGDTGQIVVGAMPLARAGLLPATIADFTTAYPRAQMRVVDGPYADLRTGLRSGDIDVLIGALRLPLVQPDVTQTALFDDQLYVVGKLGHPASSDSSPANLANFPWVLANSATPLHACWRRMFAAAGLEPPPVRVECGSVMAIRGLLLAGDWLTLLSPDQFLIEQQAGLLAPIGGRVAGSERAIGLTTRVDWQPTRLQSLFLERLRDQVRARQLAQNQ
jgi:DNA-binding transcriptional LysR family regulator